MPPKSTGTRSLDHYAAHRCVNCRHLRYANQKPGDPCQFCPCTEHVVPADQAEAARP
jgi:hypothetical protein